MKVTNYHVYGDAAKVERLRKEYEFLGRSCRVVAPGHLVVFAYPPKKEKKKRDDERTSRDPKNKDRRQAKKS